MNDFNNTKVFSKPQKPFVLISQLEDGHMMVTWHETEEDLMWIAKNNTAATPTLAFEIESSRNIAL